MAVKVRERKPGEWWIFIDHNGRRKAKKVGSKEAAETAAEKIEAKLTLGEFKIPTGERAPTFRVYAEAWLKGYVAKNLKPATLDHYTATLERFILPEFGNSPLDEIRRDEIKALCYRVAGKEYSRQATKENEPEATPPKKMTYSKATVLHIVRTMSAIFSHAIEDGIIAANPAARPGKFLKGGRPGEKADFLTREEGELLLETARKHYADFYPLLLTALRTGMRKGELRALQLGDLDFHGRFIEVRRGFSKKILSSPKSGKPRRVDMSKQLAAVLSDHKRRLAEAALKAGKTMPEWVFPSRSGEARDESNLDGCFKRCLVKAGLRDIRFHDLRHSVASWHLGAGTSPAYVRDQLGHSTIKLTVDTYGHLLPSADRTAVDLLDDAKWREIRNPAATSGQEAEAAGGK